MASTHHRQRGFTLVELVITILVMLVLSMAALPSFMAMRQRAALRSAGEEALGFWNQARMEAAKRNSLVKVGVYSDGDTFCLGAATTTDTADETPCNCTSAGACDVATFPDSQGEWRNVTLSATSLGEDSGVVVIDNKRSGLSESADAGGITFDGPANGPYDYQINLKIDSMGRGVLCESTDAAAKMSDYATRRCDP